MEEGVVLKPNEGGSDGPEDQQGGSGARRGEGRVEMNPVFSLGWRLADQSWRQSVIGRDPCSRPREGGSLGPAERGVAAAGHRRQPLQWLEEDGRRKKEGLGC